MRALAALGLLLMVACKTDPARPSPPPPSARGVLLEDLTWQEAEKKLTKDAIVVLPIGAAAKEHGPHLKLKNDFLIAEYFKHRLMEEEDVIVAPTLNYHYYPAFSEYPGSTSLRLETARDLTLDVVRSLAAYGPKRFYALNTGISTNKPLALVQEQLAKEGIVFKYTSLNDALGEVEKQVCKQALGSHADELETSMMLVIAPGTVDMSKAVKDMDSNTNGGLTRIPDAGATYSPSGCWGDPTLATKEKGEAIVKAYLAALVADVEALKKTPVP